MTKPIPPLLVASMAFVSGFCIMVVEMLGARILSPYFGGSLYVWGSIITIFMLSLATGYLYGGKLSAKNPGARTYATFFFLSALFILPIILLANSIMEPIFVAIEDERYGSLLATIMLFFIPITLMGMISPYSVRLLVVNAEQSGQVAGSLYFVSTLGSALGTLGTSFYFVLWLEIDQILWAVFFALALAGLLILAIGGIQIQEEG